MGKHREEGGVEVLQGPEVMCIWSPSITWESSTCSSYGLQTGLPRVFISQMGSLGTKAVQAPNPHPGLWGTLLDPHIAGAYALPVSRDACR